MQPVKMHQEKAPKPTMGQPLRTYRCSPSRVTGRTRRQKYQQGGPTPPHPWSEMLVSLASCPSLGLFPLPSWGPSIARSEVMRLHSSYKVVEAKSFGLSELCI